jgi:hypothetical protein
MVVVQFRAINGGEQFFLWIAEAAVGDLSDAAPLTFPISPKSL